MSGSTSCPCTPSASVSAKPPIREARIGRPCARASASTPLASISRYGNVATVPGPNNPGSSSSATNRGPGPGRRHVPGPGPQRLEIHVGLAHYPQPRLFAQARREPPKRLDQDVDSLIRLDLAKDEEGDFATRLLLNVDRLLSPRSPCGRTETRDGSTPCSINLSRPRVVCTINRSKAPKRRPMPTPCKPELGAPLNGLVSRTVVPAAQSGATPRENDDRRRVAVATENG